MPWSTAVAPVLPTQVEKCDSPSGQRWRRTISFADGKVVYFNSRWVAGQGNRLIEYVNPILGLEMAVHVADGKLYYEGVRFVVKLGGLLVPIPEWLLLGHTTIEEQGWMTLTLPWTFASPTQCSGKFSAMPALLP